MTTSVAAPAAVEALLLRRPRDSAPATGPVFRSDPDPGAERIRSGSVKPNLETPAVSQPVGGRG